MWCWWCCHDVPGKPLHLPYKYDSHTKKFSTMGCFCSWGCMKAHNITYNRVRSGIIAANMLAMYKTMYGHVDMIRCAPSRYALDTFGGTLTIEEFRKITSPNAPRVIVNMPDEVYRVQDVVIRHGIRSVTTDAESDSKFQEISRTNTTNDTLKIKRPKPLKRDTNNLEKSLGIIRKK